MKLEFTKKQLELICLGLFKARESMEQSIEEIAQLQDKLMGVILNEHSECDDSMGDIEEVSNEGYDADDDHEEFYDTFNFGAEQQNYSYKIIGKNTHLRLINGKQGQLGIEWNNEIEQPKRALFISSRDKEMFCDVFTTIHDQLKSGENIAYVSDRIASTIVYSSDYTLRASFDLVGNKSYKFILEDGNIKKYKITVVAKIEDNHNSNTPIMTIEKYDGSVVKFDMLSQIEILIKFINYHL